MSRGATGDGRGAWKWRGRRIWLATAGLLALSPGLIFAQPQASRPRPAGGPQTPNDEKARTIARAIKQAGVGAKVSVAYQNGTAIVAGPVSSPEEAKAVLAAVGKVGGVQRVDSKLRVGSGQYNLGETRRQAAAQSGFPDQAPSSSRGEVHHAMKTGNGPSYVYDQPGQAGQAGSRIQLAQATQPSKVVVHTSKSRFRIPFKFNEADLQAIGARQIVLYMSRDRGINWQQVQAVAPDAGKFNFQAPEDGEYWFVVRTLTSKNQLLPDSRAGEPELRVIVDTQKPTLKLELRQTSPGRVQLKWTANDDHLDPTQLRLEYQQPGATTWQNVSIVPKSSGQTEWNVSGPGTVAVRGIAGDYAKNSGQDQASLRIAGNRPAESTPDFREPVANEGTQLRTSMGAPLQNNSRFIPAFRQGEPIPQGSFASHQNEVPFQEASPDAGGVNHIRVVASKSFNIGYKIQDVGPSGVSAVELFVTQDRGASWKKLAEDQDLQSPVAALVQDEGIYGFSFVVRSGVGLSSDPPQPGDKPEIVIAVDQTPPRLEMLPLEQGRGSQMNKILIQWKYEDDNPVDKPVALSYSAGPEGPWQPISGWTENSGRFIWTMGRNVPPKFFVRLEGRDAAGNGNFVETPDPVLIDLSRPSARIVDVEASPQ